MRVETAAALDAALQTAADNPTSLTLIEAVVDPLDVPPLLTALAAAAAAANSRPS
jgi:indolepyruvate decarboxylase